MTHVFERIQQGLFEAIEFAKGEKSKSVVHEIAPNALAVSVTNTPPLHPPTPANAPQFPVPAHPTR